VSDDLARFLFRPIVFHEPDRVVHPPSWLEHIPFAFWIVDVLRPATIVELGTHSGNSYAAFAQAVRTLGLAAAAYAIDTWRGDEQAGFYDEQVFAEWAAYHERHFSTFSRLVRSTFEEAAPHFADGSVDLLHLDGCHTYEAASADFTLWRPKMSARGVILMHDINVRERNFGTWRLWDQLKAEYPHFAFLHGHGLGVVSVGSVIPAPLQWLYSVEAANGSELQDVRRFFSQLGGAIGLRFGLMARDEQLHRQEAALTNLTSERQRLQDENAAAQSRIDEEVTLREQADMERERLTAALEAQFNEHPGLDRLEAERLGLELQLELRNEQLRSRTRLIAEIQEQRRREQPGAGTVSTGAAGQPTSRSMSGSLRRLLGNSPGSRRRLRAVRDIPKTIKALGLRPRSLARAIRTVPAMLVRPKRLLEAQAVVGSGLFDEAFYVHTYPDVAASRLTPLAHYVINGAREGRNPHPLFDAAYYLQRNTDVAVARVNPLVHYRKRGAREGRNPHPLFDVAYYLTRNPDVSAAGIEPLEHFLRFGAAGGRDPNPYFQCSYYMQRYPDVGESGLNPLVHFVSHGWREGRRTSPAFDTSYYAARNTDLQPETNPLVHYLEFGRLEDREATAGENELETVVAEDILDWKQTTLRARSLGPKRRAAPIVLCLSHVLPVSPRTGNEYRIHRMLSWLRDQGYRILPIIAPLPGVRVEPSSLEALAAEFSNAVLCGRDGAVDYILNDVPDVLASLDGEPSRPVPLLLNETSGTNVLAQQLLDLDQTFCHDALVTTALRLQHALGPCIVVAEYIWMARVLPLLSPNAIKVIDTHDVFSAKRQKVLRFGIDDLDVPEGEEARRLQHADLVIAIQDEERRELQRLIPERRVVTAGVDFTVVPDGGTPEGRQVLYVASDNPANKRGLGDFVRFAWPYIREQVPDAELVVVGGVGDALEADIPGAIRLGVVDDLVPIYRRARLVINPAVAGTGLKIKTLEALGHLRPIVTWPTGIEGLAPELKRYCVTVRDWYEFSHRVVDVLRAGTPALFSAGDRETIARLMSPETTYQELTAALGDLWAHRNA
jgi:glycosyltransferase involved in cell wall biosynthesis